MSLDDLYGNLVLWRVGFLRLPHKSPTTIAEFGVGYRIVGAREWEVEAWQLEGGATATLHTFLRSCASR